MRVTADNLETAVETASQSERERYSTQLGMPELGEQAQARLRSSRVIVVGAGALGCPAAAYLAGAGTGVIGIADPRAVTLDGLHRQVLHFTPDRGVPRAESLAAKLGFLNPEVQATPFPALLGEENADAVLEGHDLVLDCSNDRATTLLLDERCRGQGLPLVAAGASGLDGWVAVGGSRPGACLACQAPLWPDGGGAALGPVAGIAASIQALAAIALLTATGDPLSGVVARVDGRSGRVDHAAIRPDAACAACGGSGGRSGGRSSSPAGARAGAA